MNPNSTTYQAYVQILKEELLPAMGCTEPIAIAYCAARARAMLGALPDAIEVEASGNIIKNVKSVVVPNTGSRRCHRRTGRRCGQWLRGDCKHQLRSQKTAWALSGGNADHGASG